MYIFFPGLTSLHSVNKKLSNHHYTRGITLKRVTNGRAHLRGIAPSSHGNVTAVASSWLHWQIRRVRESNRRRSAPIAINHYANQSNFVDIPDHSKLLQPPPKFSGSALVSVISNIDHNIHYFLLFRTTIEYRLFFYFFEYRFATLLRCRNQNQEPWA